MENFSVTTTSVTLKNHHTWGCPVYGLDAIMQGNIAEISRWELHSRAWIYLGHSLCHAGSVALFINPETGHVTSIACGV